MTSVFVAKKQPIILLVFIVESPSNLLPVVLQRKRKGPRNDLFYPSNLLPVVLQRKSNGPRIDFCYSSNLLPVTIKLLTTFFWNEFRMITSRMISLVRKVIMITLKKKIISSKKSCVMNHYLNKRNH